MLVVTNYCGTEFYFTIAASMYTVEGNSDEFIELAPGRHTYTVSKPGFVDIHGEITVEAGIMYTMPFTCEVR
jgi:hypothetical protein